jgi:hypothetical protein
VTFLFHYLNKTIDAIVLPFLDGTANETTEQ